MRRKPMLRIGLFMLLAGFWLAACLSPAGTAPPAGLPASAIPGIPAAPAPVKTLIPTRSPASITPLPPGGETIRVTTRAGQALTFRFIQLELNEYVAFHTEAMPQGIPLSSGMEVAWQYIDQVDFGLPSPDWSQGGSGGKWPVSLRLIDGARLASSLGFKAHHKIHLAGESADGPLDIDLGDIQSIVFKRNSTPAALPGELRGAEVFTIETTDGETLRVAGPKIFARCMYEVYCCHDETVAALPLAREGDLLFNAIQAAGLASTGAVTVTLPGGPVVQDQVRPSRECSQSGWHLRGRARLGDYENELARIKMIQRR